MVEKLNTVVESSQQQLKQISEQLRPYEFLFLKTLASEQIFTSACAKFGIARYKGFELLKKFSDMDLLVYSCERHVGCRGFTVIYSMYVDIVKTPESKVKNIFANPAMLMAYLRLKTKYHCVYPEIPLSAFIEQKTVQHLFSANWHRWYFLTSRVDFLICEAIDKPVSVVEVDGSYHSQPEVVQKDKFKEQLITEAGLFIKRIDIKDVKNI